jgi:hypothetical protein
MKCVSSFRVFSIVRHICSSSSYRTWLILVDLLQQCFRVVGAVEFHHLGRIAVVDLHDELRQLATDGLVQFLQELQATTLEVHEYN